MAKVEMQGQGWRRMRLLSANPRAVTDAIAKPFSVALEEEIGEIVKRTQSGVDENESAFAPYSPEYRAWKFKRRAGFSKKARDAFIASGGTIAKNRRQRYKTRKGYRTIKSYSGWMPVNLTLTGKMLKSIRSKVQSKPYGLLGTLFFIPSQADKARGNQARRKFFGLSKEQMSRIYQRVQDAIKTIWR